jgi:hypothetical protein
VSWKYYHRKWIGSNSLFKASVLTFPSINWGKLQKVPFRIGYRLAEIQTGSWPSQKSDWLDAGWHRLYTHHVQELFPPTTTTTNTLRQDMERTWLAEQWVLINLTFWMRQSEQEVGYSFSLSVWNKYVELYLHCPVHLCVCCQNKGQLYLMGFRY